VILLLPVLTLGFLASLLPFIYPETLFNIPGVQLNVILGELLVKLVPSAYGTLVGSNGGTFALTLPGVFAIYGPPLVLVLAALRNR
jgi:hypothetical protein